MIPVGAVVSIFAKENGEGMGFEYDEDVQTGLQSAGEDVAETAAAEERPEPEPQPPAGGGRSHLRVVK